METFIYERMWHHEGSHWWFRARREILTGLVRKWASPGARILDAGCGTGFIAEALRADYRVTLTDSAREALRFCSKRQLPGVRASLQRLPYESGIFDLVGCFDVLYHREARPLAATLGEIHRVLKPGGVIMVAEPAYQWLFGEADVLDHAAERFTASQLSHHLRAADFAVRRLGYFNTLLAPAIVAIRLLRRTRQWLWPTAKLATEFGHVSRPLNDALERVFRFEKTRVLRGGYSFGTSVICVSQKREQAPRAIDSS